MQYWNRPPDNNQYDTPRPIASSLSLPRRPCRWGAHRVSDRRSEGAEFRDGSLASSPRAGPCVTISSTMTQRTILRAPTGYAEDEYDLIVVGGGIHGASLHLEAAVSGLRSLLLERDDFGGATSWNSLRILHGGLRYLQKLDLPRFRQSVAERRWFMRSFPRHVRPLACLMPLYGEGLRRKSILRAALAVNDLLSSGRNAGLPAHLMLPRGCTLNVDAVRARFPPVRRQGLQGAALWYDGVMDSPPRILMETLRWAASRGGRALNYVEAQRIAVEGGRVSGVTARDGIGGRTLEFRAPRVALCVGPGSEVLEGLLDRPPERIPPASLAFNLVLRRPLPSADAVALTSPAPDDQVYFLHPVGQLTLAGTFHAPWEGRLPYEPDDPLVLGAIDRLSRSVDGWGLTHSDVARVLPGVLPARDPGSAELALRERIAGHERCGGPGGLFSVVGIKYTTARDVAHQALRALAPKARRGRTPRYERPTRPPGLDSIPALRLDEFLDLCATDRGAAASFVRRLLDEEAVQTIDDLVMRRMDWGLDPLRARDAAECVRRLVPERALVLEDEPGPRA